MAPKEKKDLNDTNGEPSSSTKSKKQARSQNSSTASDLQITPEELDAGIGTLNNLARIFNFLQMHHREVENLDRLFGHQMRQKEKIDFLEKSKNDILLREDHEMVRLRQENKRLHVQITELEQGRSAVEEQRRTMSDRIKAKDEEMRIQKEKDENQLRQELSTEHDSVTDKIRQELKNVIRTKEEVIYRLEENVKSLEEMRREARANLNHQNENYEIERQGYRSTIKDQHQRIAQMNAASVVEQQSFEFYSENFGRLQEAIRDIAVNELKFVPHDISPLNRDEIKSQLINASSIFKYLLISSEEPPATFLRISAIQSFISKELISLVKHKFYAVRRTRPEDQNSGVDSTDFLLNAISDVQARTPTQELSWRLSTVEKLDRLESQFPPTHSSAISTTPDQSKIVQGIKSIFHHFQDPFSAQLETKLANIVSIAFKIWGALRKDDCLIEFETDPSGDKWNDWQFVDYNEILNTHDTPFSPSEIDQASLPEKSYVLFPRITGVFAGDEAPGPKLLHHGVALSHDSMAFKESVSEYQHISDQIRNTTKELQRGRRALSSGQTSPVAVKLPIIRPKLHN